MKSSPASLKVLNLARSEGSDLGHDWLGCEHLLLGLLHEEAGTAAGELHSSGITLNHARQELVRLVGPRQEPIAFIAPTSRELEDMLEAAEKEALFDGDTTQVEPMHLLRALLAEPDGVHMVILRNLRDRSR